MKKIIRHILADVDGCIYNTRFHSSKGAITPRIYESNQPLIEYLLNTADQFHRTVFAMGSSRQSISIECGSLIGKPSSAYVLPALASRIPNSDINTLLLSDIFATSSPNDVVAVGKNFDLILPLLKENWMTYALSISATPKTADETIFETNKIMLLYTHMHLAASLNPDDDHTLEFLDDRIDILEVLVHFFGSNTDFIPQNLTLKLHLYNGDFDLVKPCVIPGTGTIDQKFDWTIRYLAAVADLEKTCTKLQQPLPNLLSTRAYFTSDQMKRIHKNSIYETENYVELDVEHNGSDAEKTAAAIERLKDFREKSQLDLTSTMPAEHTNYYTSPQALLAAGKIADRHLYQQHRLIATVTYALYTASADTVTPKTQNQSGKKITAV